MEVCLLYPDGALELLKVDIEKTWLAGGHVYAWASEANVQVPIRYLFASTATVSIFREEGDNLKRVIDCEWMVRPLAARSFCSGAD